MSFTILIVEDEELFSDQLEMLIDKLGYNHLASVNNAADALRIVAKSPPDLILMDVNIQGDYDGIELADLLHREQPLPIIFITSLHDDRTFARASRTGPLGFLLKPFNAIQLQRSIELTVKQLMATSVAPTSLAPAAAPITTVQNLEKDNWEKDFLFNGYFFVKNRNHLEKVAVANILYLQADGHYCQVHTALKKFLIHQSLTELGKRLPPEQFLATHRSYLVNVNQVSAVDLLDGLLTVGPKTVPVSKRNREVILKQFDWI